MGCKVAQAGFLVLLLSSSVVQGDTDYGVIYSSTKICALQGSAVDISCTYTYPSRIKENVTVVEEAVWFTKMNSDEPVDLMTDSEFAGRVQYLYGENICTLKLTDLRMSDSAEYKFMFRTNQPGEKMIGSPGVTLSVTALQVTNIGGRGGLKPDFLWLTCRSSCHLPGHYSYIWYHNGEILDTKTDLIAESFDSLDSVACAVEGYEKFPSPSLCVHQSPCNSVDYTHRSICVPKGSSVNISCTYRHNVLVLTKFWFSPERSHQPQNLIEDLQYAGRVQVFNKEGGSTLLIRDVRVTDSAQYKFKFTSQWFGWRSNLPGTTLTVTALQVQVTRIISVHQYHTEAELKCHSSCNPADRLSYIWFKNGQNITEQQTSTYTGSFYPGDKVSCAFKGYEDHRSPLVYPSVIPSVSVSPSAEIMEGSSVSLTCSSDANPAANYTWYKENEDSPLHSGQNFTITDFRAEHSGNYYCEVQNTRGRHNSTLYLTVAGKTALIPNVIWLTLLVLGLIPLILFIVWMRKKKSSSHVAESNELMQ